MEAAMLTFGSRLARCRLLNQRLLPVPLLSPQPVTIV